MIATCNLVLNDLAINHGFFVLLIQAICTGKPWTVFLDGTKKNEVDLENLRGILFDKNFNHGAVF